MSPLVILQTQNVLQNVEFYVFCFQPLATYYTCKNVQSEKSKAKQDFPCVVSKS